jgi:hypothetical protein
MFEILVDLYVIVAHYMVQPNLLGLVNVGDTLQGICKYMNIFTIHF